MVRGGSIVFSLLFAASVIANAAAAGQPPALVAVAGCAATPAELAGRLDVGSAGGAEWLDRSREKDENGNEDGSGHGSGDGDGDGSGSGSGHGPGSPPPPPGGGASGSPPAPGTTPPAGPGTGTPTGTSPEPATGGDAGTTPSTCDGPPPDPAPGAVAGDGTLPPAIAGETVNVERTQGVVLVRQPGSRSIEPLTASARLAAGSVIDTTAGSIELTSAGGDGQQTAAFGGGRFKVRQRRGKALTELVLRGGSFGRCERPRARGGVAASGARPRRHLWGAGHGKFRTRGRHGSATVRGTVWNVEDRCDGTRVMVRRGVVQVADFHRRRTVTVSAGESYLARARLRTSR
jgi:hypothetical protein